MARFLLERVEPERTVKVKICQFSRSKLTLINSHRNKKSKNLGQEVFLAPSLLDLIFSPWKCEGCTYLKSKTPLIIYSFLSKYAFYYSVLSFNFQGILRVLCVHSELLHQSNPRHQTTLWIKRSTLENSWEVRGRRKGRITKSHAKVSAQTWNIDWTSSSNNTLWQELKKC